MLNKLKSIELIVAVLLLLCLARMPYGFYTLVRFVAMVSFAWLAYQQYRLKKEVMTVVFIALALLFQPFVMIRLGREMWSVTDVVVAAFLLLLWWRRIRSGSSDYGK